MANNTRWGEVEINFYDGGEITLPGGSPVEFTTPATVKIYLTEEGKSRVIVYV